MKQFRIMLEQLNLFSQCKKYKLPLWQCPQFLFVVMGIIIIATSLLTYLIGARYIDNPLIVAFIVSILAIILFIISFIITHSFERLAEVVRMKSEFVSVVSHQLRSPLSNLRWGIEAILSKHLEQEEKKEYFNILKENTERMNELVSDLLTVSRIEQERLPLEKKSFDLKSLVKELISEFKPFAEASNVEISFKSEKIPEAFADPERIKLVITNLLDNAIRYVEKEGKIEISLRKKNNKVLFKIKDNGVGIPKKDQKYIFQKFFRSQNVLKQQTQGSGLGLFIVKSIVERSGGKIWFKSKEGKGTTFFFTLPIKEK